MNRTYMKARITDQHLTLANLPLIASGGVDEVKIRFEFCNLWDGCGKTAVFYRDPEEVYHIPIAEGLAVVPHEVLAEEGYFYLGVMGSADNIRTTEVVRVYVAQGAITEATANHEEPTPDIYQQIMAAYGMLDSRLTEIVAMRGSANTSTFSITDAYFQGDFRTNGTGARVYLAIGDLSLEANGEYTSPEYNIPVNFAPFGDVRLQCNHPDLAAAFILKEINAAEGYCLMAVKIRNTTSNPGQYRGAIADAYYPTASVFIDELADIRVDYDGKTYATAGEAVRAQIDAATKTAIDRCCPTFSDSGKTVDFEPIEGYPLGVVSKIAPFQAGSGDPSFDNIREIRPHAAVELDHNQNTYCINFGQDVYGGRFDWNSGILTIDRKMVTLDGTEVWATGGSAVTGVKRYRLTKSNNPTLLSNIKLHADLTNSPADDLLCSKFPTISADKTWGAKTNGISAENAAAINFVHTQYGDDLEGFKAMIKGAQIVFGLENPIIVQLTPQEIIALPGVNSFYSDTGDTTVTGKADPTAVIEKLTNAIIALGGNI